MFRHGPKCFCAILLPGSRFWSLEPRFSGREDLRFWLWEKGSLVQPLSSQTALVGPIARLQCRWLQKTFKTLKHGKCEMYSLNWRYSHAISNIPQLMWHFMSFCITPFFCARSVWVMRAWPTFKTRRPTKNPKSWSIEVFFMENFHPPLYETCHLSPKMGGGNWGNRVSLSTRIFLEMSVDGQSLLIFVGTWSCHPWSVWSSVKDAVLGDMNIDTWDLFISRKT